MCKKKNVISQKKVALLPPCRRIGRDEAAILKRRPFPYDIITTQWDPSVALHPRKDGNLAEAALSRLL